MGRLNAPFAGMADGERFLNGRCKAGGGVTNGLGNRRALILQVYALLRSGGILFHPPLASSDDPDAAPDHHDDKERRPKTVRAMSAQPWQG